MGKLDKSRSCLACDSGLVVEGEEHFLLSCVTHETLRKDFISKLHNMLHIKVSSSVLNMLYLKEY